MNQDDDTEPGDTEPGTTDLQPGTTHLQPGTMHFQDDSQVRDELPEDLDAVGYVGPYMFPDNNRRRIPGFIYLGLGACCVAAKFLAADDAVLINNGILIAGIGLILLGLFHLQAGFNLLVDEQDALVEASRQVGFPVGHASAQLGWRGLRSRPTWRILLYEAEVPPKQRGFVLIDGVDGSVVEYMVDTTDEDWDGLDLSLSDKEIETNK